MTRLRNQSEERDGISKRDGVASSRSQGSRTNSTAKGHQASASRGTGRAFENLGVTLFQQSVISGLGGKNKKATKSRLKLHGMDESFAETSDDELALLPSSPPIGDTTELLENNGRAGFTKEGHAYHPDFFPKKKFPNFKKNKLPPDSSSTPSSSQEQSASQSPQTIGDDTHRKAVTIGSSSSQPRPTTSSKSTGRLRAPAPAKVSRAIDSPQTVCNAFRNPSSTSSMSPITLAVTGGSYLSSTNVPKDYPTPTLVTSKRNVISSPACARPHRAAKNAKAVPDAPKPRPHPASGMMTEDSGSVGFRDDVYARREPQPMPLLSPLENPAKKAFLDISARSSTSRTTKLTQRPSPLLLKRAKESRPDSPPHSTPSHNANNTTSSLAPFPLGSPSSPKFWGTPSHRAKTTRSSLAPFPLGSPRSPDFRSRTRKSRDSDSDQESSSSNSDKVITKFSKRKAKTRPFPMATQMLEAIGDGHPPASSNGSSKRSSLYSDEEGGPSRRRRRTESISDLSVELADINYTVMEDRPDPSSLCPYCDEPFPSEPSALLTDILSRLRFMSYPDPRPANLLGLKAPLSAFVSLCQRHRFESVQLPRAKAKGWPTSINFAGLPRRIEALQEYLRQIVEAKEESHFWREIDKEIGMNGTRMAMGVRGQFANFEKSQPGYYGEQGAIIINHTLYTLFPPSSLNAELIAPLTPAEFIQRVLVPEAAVALIREDMTVDTETAIETLRSSSQYGVAMFPDMDREDEEEDVAEEIVRERARVRRQEIEEEENEDERKENEKVKASLVTGKQVVRPRRVGKGCGERPPGRVTEGSDDREVAGKRLVRPRAVKMGRGEKSYEWTAEASDELDAREITDDSTSMADVPEASRKSRKSKGKKTKLSVTQLRSLGVSGSTHEATRRSKPPDAALSSTLADADTTPRPKEKVSSFLNPFLEASRTAKGASSQPPALGMTRRTGRTLLPNAQPLALAQSKTKQSSRKQSPWRRNLQSDDDESDDSDVDMVAYSRISGKSTDKESSPFHKSASRKTFGWLLDDDS